MNIVIIYAHPNPTSFNNAILEQVQQGLNNSSHNVETIDLYSDGFNPVFTFNEKAKRSELANDPETARYRELIKQADQLIFIYPIWWYGMPAILKGFFDRVFVSGFAYTSAGNIQKGLLGGKSAWVIYTIDSPVWFIKLFRGNIEWKVVKKAILNYCGIKRVEKTRLAGVKNSDQNRRKKWLELIYGKANRI